MGSLKSPCTTFYRSSIETIVLICGCFGEINDDDDDDSFKVLSF